MYLNCTATPAKPHFFFSFSFFLFFLPPQKQEGLNRTIKVHWIGIYIHICIDGDLWVRIRGVYPQPNKAEPSKRAAEAAATAVESTLIEPSSVGNLWLCCVVSLFAAIFTIPYATPLPPWKAFPIYVRATDRWAPKWSHLTTSTDVDCTAALCINYLEYGDAGKTHRLEKYAISFWRDCCQAWHKCFLIAPFWLRLCVSRNCKLG